MKGRLFLWVVLGMLLLCGSVLAADLPFVVVFVDGKQTSGMIVTNRTMVPLRTIAESMGAEVEWIADIQNIVVKKSGKKIALEIGRNMALINENPVYLDKAPMLINDKTMVPLRFISENLGAKVHWDEYTRTVYISTTGDEIIPPKPVPPMPLNCGPEQLKWFADIIGPKAVFTSNNFATWLTVFEDGKKDGTLDYGWYIVSDYGSRYQIRINKYMDDSSIEHFKVNVLDRLLSPKNSEKALNRILYVREHEDYSAKRFNYGRDFMTAWRVNHIEVQIGY